MDITQLEPGDPVTRLLADTIPMPMRVVRVDHGRNISSTCTATSLRVVHLVVHRRRLGVRG